MEPGDRRHDPPTTGQLARRRRIGYHLDLFLLNFQICGRKAMFNQPIDPAHPLVTFTRRRPCVARPCVGFDP
jgi:hypothetical protein